MLLLNDQLRHHLENWDVDPSVANDTHVVVVADSLVDKESECDKDNKLTVGRGNKKTSHSRNSGILLALTETLNRLYCMALLWDAPAIATTLFVGGFAWGIYYHDHWNRTCLHVWYSVFIRVILCGSVTAAAVCGVAFLRRRFHKRNAAVLQSHRIALASLLSQIGAPPPSVSSMKMVLEHPHPTQIVQEAIILVQAFSHLLRTIDSCLDRIKSASSMELGLGIWSPAISRVEQHRQLQHRPMRRSTCMASAKQILAQGMQRAREVLWMRQRQDDDDCDEQGAGAMVPLQNVAETVVTISWLQAARRDLVLALTQCIWIPRSQHDMRYCLDAMEEIDAYLKASFFECPKDESSSLHLVAQSLHAAEIALWAYCKDSDNEKANIAWMQRFHAFLQVASALQETNNMGNAADTRTEVEDAQEQSSLCNIISSPLSFEDTENHLAGNKKLSHVQKPVSRTLVFSGTGRVTQKKLHAAIVNDPLPPSTFAGAAMAQALLFQELQTRLAVITHSEEINVDGVDSDREDGVQEADENHDTPRQQFAIPGGLLAELVSSITTNPRGGGAMELFCDHDVNASEEHSA